MKQMQGKRGAARLAAMLLSLVLLLSVCAATAFAYERVDTAATTSVTVSLNDNGTPIPGTNFKLYKFAEISDAVRFTLTSDFAAASVSLEDVESDSQWVEIAGVLATYAAANPSLTPAATGTTDEGGQVTFAGLPVGLYLLVGDTTVLGDFAYAPSASVIMLPSLDENDNWVYSDSVTLDTKYTKTFLPEYQSLTVKKVWSGDSSNQSRPTSVTVQLLKDGQAVETVTLNASNSWTYSWSDLQSTYLDESGVKKAYAYTVQETNVPANYTASVTQSETTFTITNTYTVKQNKLPQTGMLNWPIPVLTISGLLLVGIGWYVFNRKKQ